MQGWRRIAAHVSSDDGTHAPVLTVRETLRFAAECTHSKEDAGQKIEDVVSTESFCEVSNLGRMPLQILNPSLFLSLQVNEVMEILDLTSAADTIVGDENLRGVSGGQKRR